MPVSGPFSRAASLRYGNAVDDAGTVVGDEQGTVGRDGYSHGAAQNIFLCRVGDQTC